MPPSCALSCCKFGFDADIVQLALDSGGFGAPAVLPNLPTLNNEQVHLTNVIVTQALSERFVVFAGKLDTLDGDMNDFAHGRGKTQFFNTNFVFNPIAVQTIPYSTLGAGFSILQGADPIFTFSLLNATDTTTTSGFDELFDEGVALAVDIRLPTQFLGRPGHQGGESVIGLTEPGCAIRSHRLRTDS